MDTTADCVTPFVDDDARDRVSVVGPDAQRYLQSQLAQDIDGLAVGASVWTLVLEPTGKVDSVARVTRSGDESFVLDTDAGFGGALTARLARFKIRVQAEITLDAAEGALPSDENEAARIAVGWPRLGAEIVPGETIPATTGLVPLAVSHTKGCYPGQELVERMDSRGADAPRSLRIIDVAAGSSVGDPIVDADGSEVGVLTSVAGELALGYVKRGAEIGRPPTHTP